MKYQSRYLTSQDLKEVSTNYLRYVIKNTDNDKFRDMAQNELIERTTTTFFDGNKHIKI